MTNFYEVLGVARGDSLERIRAAYKRIALQVHPDKCGGSKETFQAVLQAFETLSDPIKRYAHDCEVAGSDQSCVAKKASECASPVHSPGAESPLAEGTPCRGVDLAKEAAKTLRESRHLPFTAQVATMSTLPAEVLEACVAHLEGGKKEPTPSLLARSRQDAPSARGISRTRSNQWQLMLSWKNFQLRAHAPDLETALAWHVAIAELKAEASLRLQRGARFDDSLRSGVAAAFDMEPSLCGKLTFALDAKHNQQRKLFPGTPDVETAITHHNCLQQLKREEASADKFCRQIALAKEEEIKQRTERAKTASDLLRAAKNALVAKHQAAAQKRKPISELAKVALEDAPSAKRRRLLVVGAKEGADEVVVQLRRTLQCIASYFLEASQSGQSYEKLCEVASRGAIDLAGLGCEVTSRGAKDSVASLADSGSSESLDQAKLPSFSPTWLPTACDMFKISPAETAQVIQKVQDDPQVESILHHSFIRHAFAIRARPLRLKDCSSKPAKAAGQLTSGFPDVAKLNLRQPSSQICGGDRARFARRFQNWQWDGCRRGHDALAAFLRSERTTAPYFTVRELFRISCIQRDIRESLDAVLQEQLADFSFARFAGIESQTSTSGRKIRQRRDPNKLAHALVGCLSSRRLLPLFRRVDLSGVPVAILIGHPIPKILAKMPHLESITYPSTGWPDPKEFGDFVRALPRQVRATARVP